MNKTQARAIATQLKSIISYKEKNSDIIQDKVLRSRFYRDAKVIFVYASKSDEVHTDRIITTALKEGKRVFVPKCINDREMIAVEIRSLNELRKGFFRIREPESNEEADRNEIDVAIIPCVACTPDGTRLGHGAGYYDRYLSGSSFTKIALCYHGLLLNDIEADAHDIPMDYVVTEFAVYKNPN